MITPHTKEILVNVAISALFLGVVVFFYNRKPANIVENATTTKIEKVETFKVGLVISYASKETSYSAKTDSKSSLYDLMETFRKDDKLAYNITSFTYGTVIDSLNGIANRPGAAWTLYVNGSKSDTDIKKLKVQKNSVYMWRYE